jgi:predicted AAA+ superfamily ATPase
MLSRFGGFPEPLAKGEESFARQWRDLRQQQLLREDLRDLTRIREVALVEQLLHLLDLRSATALNLSHLAQDLGVNAVSVKQWLQVLLMLHQGFLLKPWTRKVSRSLTREPKWYSRDWSGVLDPGQRFETLVACHLLKAVDLWNDLGRGRFELHYIRNREHQEVDFLVTKDLKPWLLVEAKVSDTTLNPSLSRFHLQLGTEHALQVVGKLPWTGQDAFALRKPSLISAQDLLGQLP